MRLSRKKSGIWRLDYEDETGKRRRISLGTRDKRQAELKAMRYVSGQDDSVKDEAASLDLGWTLGMALRDTYNRIWDHQKSARERLSQVNLLEREYGEVPCEDISYRMLSEWAKDWLAAGNKPATVNRKMSTIVVALREAHRMGGRRAGPPQAPRQTERNIKTRWLTTEEVDTLLESCCILPEFEARGMRNLLTILVDTGCRLSEALRAPQTEHPDGALTFLFTKNGRSRSVPLTKRAQTAFNQGWPDWNKDKVIHRFHRVRKQAGLTDVTLHTLRHTCASHLVQNGVDLYRVSEWLGHSSMAVTQQRYAHLTTASLDDLRDVLERHSSGTLRSIDGGKRA